ncbi:putative DNA-binding protein [Lactobacillus sp. YT155]|uniref:putative DNA-binding protein n=1 Tax=Lactobacillus sp. YT155 TaxID=3060955 RepID=UPI00265E824F|nr:putative DNA-binding protein [Lactobacillus sp. YT155]MDO1605532.1 putative DNA-binding protein [Lactobacillus sp. YT155]
MELEKNKQMNILFNFYGELLTDKQHEYMSLYYVEDLSLGEIAEQFNVSRQAVYDNLKRSEEILDSYEKKLKIVANSQSGSELSAQLLDYAQQNYASDLKLIRMIEDLNNLSNR